MKIQSEIKSFKTVIVMLLICLLYNPLGNAGILREKINKLVKKKRTEEDTDKLKNIMNNPRIYLGRKVTFFCRFSKRGTLYKAANTKYSERYYTNIYVWPAKAELWKKEDRRSILPTLYVKVTNKDVVDTVAELKKYDLILLTANITNAYANLPWLDVTKIEKLSDWDERLNDNALVHIRSGLKLEEQGKTLLAADHFQMAIDSYIPASYRGFVYQRLGNNLFLNHKLAAADSAYAKALAADSNQAESLLARAEISLKMKKPDDAIDFCTALLKHSAKYPELYAILGEAYGMLGQTVKGLHQCDLTSNTPGITPEQRAKAEVHRARIFAWAKRYTEAVGSYARAIGENSPLASAAWLRKEIGKFYEGRYMATGDTDLLSEAIREYKNANGITGNTDLDGLLLLAQTYFEDSRAKNSTDFQKSQEILARINLLNPSYISARVLAGKIATAQGDVEGSAKIFQSIVDENPNDPDAHLALAKVYEHSNQLEKALAAYERVTQLTPTTITAWRKSAQLNETLGHLDRAESAFVELVKLNPDEPLYHYNLGRLALLSNDYARAIKESRKAIVAGPQGEAPLYNLSIALEAENDLVGAERQLAALLQLNPHNYTATAHRAYLLAELGKNLQQAALLADKVVKAKPGLVEGKDALGYVEYKRGNNEAALVALGSIAEEKRTRSVWYHLGLIYTAQEKFKKAIPAVRKAMLPVRADEVRAIAERLIEAAKKLLPQVITDQKEAQRRAQIEERVEAIRRKEEERFEKQLIREIGTKPVKKEEQVEINIPLHSENKDEQQSLNKNEVESELFIPVVKQAEGEAVASPKIKIGEAETVPMPEVFGAAGDKPANFNQRISRLELNDEKTEDFALNRQQQNSVKSQNKGVQAMAGSAEDVKISTIQLGNTTQPELEQNSGVDTFDTYELKPAMKNQVVMIPEWAF